MKKPLVSRWRRRHARKGMDVMQDGRNQPRPQL